MCCQKDLRLIIQSHSLFCTKPCLWLQEWCACAVVMQTATDYCLLVHLCLHDGGGVTAMRVHSFVPAICAGFEVAIVI